MSKRQNALCAALNMHMLAPPTACGRGCEAACVKNLAVEADVDGKVEVEMAWMGALAGWLAGRFGEKVTRECSGQKPMFLTKRKFS